MKKNGLIGRIFRVAFISVLLAILGGLLGTLLPFSALGKNLVTAQEDFIVTIGEDRVFTEFNYHEAWFENDPNNSEPWPDQREACSEGNLASVSLSATPGHAGVARARTGVQFEWNLGEFTWEEVRNWPIEVTIGFSYQISAYWVEDNGSANAFLGHNLIGFWYDGIGYETGQSGSRSNTVSETYPTTVEGLDGLGRRIILHANCQAHSIYEVDEEGNPVGTTHSSSTDITINSIGIEFAEPLPTVEIMGPPAIVIYNRVPSSPKVVLEALVDPVGGDYEWQILLGQDKARFVGNTHGESAAIKGIGPSEEKNDVVIKLTYTIGSQCAEAIHYITVQRPNFLEVLDGYPQTERQYDDDGNVVDYTTTYCYQVMDQLNPANPINAQMRVTEFLTVACANVWYGYTHRPVYFRSVFTNDLGAVCDDFTPPLRRFGPPIPVNLLIKSQQLIDVAGWLMDVRCLTYFYDYATSEEGICGECE